jgi:phospholipase/carboxylesterase
MAILSGPRVPPANGRATELVVLLHGYGADGNDLIGLVPHWQKLLPGAAFVAPHAPERVPGAQGMMKAGFQWFPIARLDPHEMRDGVALAAPGIGEFLDAELARLGLAPERLVLAGFSQGAMLALHLGLRRSVAAIVGFSGLLPDSPPAEGPRPPVFLTHGSADDVIPAGAMFATATSLGVLGVGVQWHLAPGMGHGIDEMGLSLAGNFLKLAFAGRLKAREPLSCPL